MSKGAEEGIVFAIAIERVQLKVKIGIPSREYTNACAKYAEMRSGDKKDNALATNKVACATGRRSGVCSCQDESTTHLVFVCQREADFEPFHHIWSVGGHFID